ncbi:AzlD domain-containing protein [Bullifex porci]|nr:AzlD domain-containing protein [Bullifex porci]
MQQSYDLPKTISTIVASLVTAGLYLYRRSMLIPIAGGTIVYMLMVQFVF